MRGRTTRREIREATPEIPLLGIARDEADRGTPGAAEIAMLLESILEGRTR